MIVGGYHKYGLFKLIHKYTVGWSHAKCPVAKLKTSFKIPLTICSSDGDILIYVWDK